MSLPWDASPATAPAPSVAAPAGGAWSLRERARALAARAPRPELLALIALAAVLYLWTLTRNGLANEYYAAAVHSMSTSWHDFLFASLDRSGVMTVDKPPLALWVQALSVRVFGYHSLSILLPQALMGVASVVLTYDLVRRRFGRVGGFVGGLALAVTPITVAVSRHNNPDALLVLCCVAALWCAVRALEDGRTRWLVLAGVCVGLGFETKMGVALTVLPGIVAAWLWLAPAALGRLRALRQLLAGGVAMVLVGGAWPALVELVPAAERPWVSGTSDNRVLSLIFGYNGLGRVDGQTTGPGGAGGGSVFGGSPGPLRLLNSALGGQAGWLLGFALVSGLAILAATRLRRSDARTGWLIIVGGAFATTAVLFSAASGIFHPYYVSLLAPFAAALVGAGAAELIRGRLSARVAAPLAIAAGVSVELIVRANYPGQLTWLAPVLITLGLLAAIALVAFRSPPVRAVAVGAAVGALLLAPSVWAFDTLGHASSGTFPSGGPASALGGGFGGPGGGSGGPGGGFGGPGGGSAGPAARGRGVAGGASGGATQLFGPAGGPQGPPGGSGFGGGPAGFGGGARAAGGPFGGGETLTRAIAYAKQHGGGTIAVSSQSSAASAIVRSDANVAGIGGFSGRESDVSASWLAQEVRTGKIRWVLDEQSSGGFGAGLRGDTRAGSKAAMAAVARACTAVSLPAGAARASTGAASSGRGSSAGSAALYDCQGRAGELAGTATQQSSA
jgi:4-amino-4-deoxy-L-arabinose transferase-like glycosyltransferase